MNHPGWLVVAAGTVIVCIGLVWMFVSNVPWLGRLPGDIHIEGQNSRFFFPMTTCILLSVALSVLVWMVRRFF